MSKIGQKLEEKKESGKGGGGVAEKRIVGGVPRP